MLPPQPDSWPASAGPTAVTESRAEQNRILRALAADDYALLQPHMERMDVPLLAILTDEHTPFSHVFFPETGVISVVNRLTEGGLVEVGTVGNEGMAGLSVVLDAESLPSVTMMQIPGEVTRVPAAEVRAVADASPSFRRLINRYAQAFLIQVAQTAACNRAHDITARCARWMLMAHDRMGGAEHFLLTQEVLSQMLGVRRAGVSVAAGTLQRSGLIRYSRGRITVLDRAGLENAACECYAVVKREFERLVG